MFASAVLAATGIADSTRPGLAFQKQFGGSSTGVGIATAVDFQGNVYVVGYTTSSDFPVKNALQSHLGGAPLRFTADGGKTWSTSALPEAILCAGGSATRGGTLYAGSYTGMYKSADSGKTWTKLKIPGPVTVISVDPTNANTILVVASHGIFRSTDAGASFTGAGFGGYVLGVARSPVAPSSILAAASGAPANSVYESIDSGKTWNMLSGSPGSIGALAADPANANIWYAAAASYFGPGSIYKTVDNGLTWTTLTNTGATSLAVSTAGVFAAASNGLIQSRDGGVTWTATSLSAPVSQVAVDPANPQTVYAAGNQVYMSSDGGAHWTLALPARQGVNALAVLPGPPSTLFVCAATSQNIFVSKWTGDGQQMLYSTYLGGSYLDFASGIAVDPQGNAYIAGFTYSNDFPVTTGALQTKTSATYAPFAAKIGADGQTLAYSTYVGGSNYDAAFAIAVDATGHAYLAGTASSADFPVTAGAFHSHGGFECTPATVNSEATYSNNSMFAAKLSPDGSSLLYSGVAAGSCGEQGESIAVDGSGNAFIAGTTLSDDFPVTAGALQSVTGFGVATGFLMKVSPQGSLLYSTLIGGPFGSTADAVALDSNGNPYLTGCSTGFDSEQFTIGSSIFIVPTVNTPGFAGPWLNTPCPGAAYTLKLTAAGTSRTYLKYIGAAYGDGYAIAVDAAGRAWVSGEEQPDNVFTGLFPLVHPFAVSTSNGFVSEISADGGSLLFSSNSDAYGSLALDASGNAYLTGAVNTAAAASNLQDGLVLGPALPESPSAALLTRIDSAVPAAVTVEAPAPIGFATPSDAQPLGIAPGQLITLTGAGLGPAQAVQTQIANGLVAKTLASTSVTFDGVPAPLISVQANQIVCVVPFATGTNGPNIIQPTVMQVSSGGALSNSILVAVQLDQVEILSVLNQDGAPNSAAHPAAAGSIVTVYASGFGQTDPPGVDGQVNGAGAATPDVGPVAVTFPNSTGAVQILYAGPAAGQVAGIFQVNFRVPDLPPGANSGLLGPLMLDAAGNPLVDSFGNPIGPGTLSLFASQ